MSSTGTHSGNELRLLLEGAKPLAVFFVNEGDNEEDYFEGQNFEQAVSKNKILRFEKVYEFEGLVTKYIAFVTPQETWRAHAYFHLKEFMYKRSWCSHLEWIEGSLLGYSDDENKAHLGRKYGNRNHKDPC